MHVTKAVVVGLSMMAATSSVGQPPKAAGDAVETRFDPAEVVTEVRRIVSERYVLPERRPALDAVLAEGLRSKRYLVTEPALLAERVNADLARVGRDHHLNFKYDPARVAMMMARTAGGEPDFAAFQAEVRRNNHGVRQLKVLPGNARYLELVDFDWLGDETAEVHKWAMAFLKGGDAVIIDLRRNGGGAGPAVHQIISHFVKAGTPLLRFHKGSEVSPTMASLSGLSDMVGKPLYVLTSGQTGSAAEEFVGHVAGYRLGEVVGSTTSGAAFMNGMYAIEGGFELSVSEARPVLAATGKDWEGTGIAPTISAPVEEALETAHIHALRKIASTADATRRAQLEAMAEGLEAFRRPATPTAPLAAYAGSYGERELVLSDGKLWLVQGRRPPRLMVPLGDHRFTLADDPLVRVTFHLEGTRITALDYSAAGGPVLGRFERSQ